ncbi:putative transporter SEO1 [Wickerhamomyces ciferrii]|uniref:Transporter SEO1 n=1 Tax=Wickerhamomyces ciferrii (strain ATCC 14091 / BCRC 22168 / CBS 111 / JCM 3599 / NBRC 0793 / NRRL Y-1031 F-60-10) TaxID=1206466 RepID=K0KPS7_WICCF|nr:putative transporter SEO1 [Wickerhamomyces ciferrii]CCH44167.1 putative transporter SEO1 [Wickerhamomyces ciferrii]
MNLIGNAILAVWDVPDSAKWVGFCFGYWSWSQSSTFYPLMNDILRHDANQRSIEWILSYLFCAQSNVWLNKIMYPTTEAPKFTKGFTGAACWSAVQGIAMMVGLVFYKRDEKREAYDNGIVVYNSAKGETKESALLQIREKISKETNGEVEAIAVSSEKSK